MRILHYMSRIRLEDGGVVRAVLDLCAVMAERGHDVTLLTLDATDVPRDWGSAGKPRAIALKRSGSPIPALGKAELGRVKSELRGSQMFHLHVPWDPVCMQLGRLARREALPYLVSLHGMLDDWTIRQKGLKKRLYLALGGRRMLEQAAAVHCTAQAEMDQSKKWYPRGRSAVIPLLVDVRPFDPLPGPELAREKFPAARTDLPLVLFMGRLNPIKRIELLIAAAAELKKMGAAFRVLLAGPADAAYEKQLREQAARLDVRDEVVFLGFVSGREKISLYEVAAVFMLPSHHENFGFVSVESLACRTPVVTTKGVNIWPELQAGGGAIIAAAEPADVARALKSIIDDPARRRAMGEAGRTWVLRDLSIDSLASRYERLYREGR